MCADADGEVICVDLRRTFDAVERAFGLLPPIVTPPGGSSGGFDSTDNALPPLQRRCCAFDCRLTTANLRELPRPLRPSSSRRVEDQVLNFKQIVPPTEAGRMAARAALQAQPDLVNPTKCRWPTQVSRHRRTRRAVRWRSHQ